MKLIITDDALAKFNSQIDYIIDQGNPAAARRLHDRVIQFLSVSLTFMPRNGHYMPDHDMWETWIPKTKFVVWYIFDERTLTIIDLWHTSQDRYHSAGAND